MSLYKVVAYTDEVLSPSGIRFEALHLKPFKDGDEIPPGFEELVALAKKKSELDQTLADVRKIVNEIPLLPLSDDPETEKTINSLRKLAKEI